MIVKTFYKISKLKALEILKMETYRLFLVYIQVASPQSKFLHSTRRATYVLHMYDGLLTLFTEGAEIQDFEMHISMRLK